jgi:hypothetical protein
MAQHGMHVDRVTSSWRSSTASRAFVVGLLLSLLQTSGFCQQTSQTGFPHFMPAPDPTSITVELKPASVDDGGRLRTFIKAVEALGGSALVKGEFESTAQYEARTADFGKNIVSGYRLSHSIAFAFPANTLNIKYDVGQERFEAGPNYSDYGQGFFTEIMNFRKDFMERYFPDKISVYNAWVKMVDPDVEETTYSVRSNLGEEFTIHRRRGDNYGLLLAPLSYRDSPDPMRRPSWPAMHVVRSDALEVKKHLIVILIGKTIFPPIKMSHDLLQPTTQTHFDIDIMNHLLVIQLSDALIARSDNGKVLARIAFRGGTISYPPVSGTR